MAFSCADHNNIIQTELSNLFNDSILSMQYVPKAKALSCIASRNSTRVVPIDHCKSVKAYYSDHCGTASAACDTSCDFDTAAANTGECVTYSIGKCEQQTFAISDTSLDCNEFQFSNEVAKLKASAIKTIVENINADFVAEIETQAGQNQYVHPDANIVVGATDTTLPASYWTLGTFAPYLDLVQEYNFNGVLLTGSKFYSEAYHSQFAIGDSSREQASLVGALGFCADPVVVDAQLGSGAYLIDPNSVLLANYARNIATSPMEAKALGNQGDGITIPLAWKETINVAGLTLQLDVFYKYSCEDLYNKKHVWKIIANYDTLKRPEACDKTGVLKFLCA